MILTLFDVIELLGELEALKLYADELEARQRWIPVSEGELMPHMDYLTIDESGEIDKMKYVGVLDGVQKWLWSDGKFYRPTHYMPLPEPPNDKQSVSVVYQKECEK